MQKSLSSNVPLAQAPLTQPLPLSAGLYPIPSVANAFPNFESATDVHNLLEKKSRQLGAEIRMLEQRRQTLRSIEKDRDALYRELATAVETLTDSARILGDALGEIDQPVDVQHLFENNLAAHDALENVSASLTTNFHCWRAACEQYTQTCERAKILKAEMSAAEPLVDA